MPPAGRGRAPGTPFKGGVEKKRESGWLPFLFAVAMGEMCDGGWIPAFSGTTSRFYVLREVEP
jgi:hypothetical protein